MTYTDAVSRIGQIQDQIASMRTPFAPQAAQTTQTGTRSAPAASATVAASFSNALSGAMGSTPAGAVQTGALTGQTSSLTGQTGALTGQTTATASGALPARAATMLTSDQQRFASRLSADTGLDSGVVSAWLLAEESGGAATSRQSVNNNDWLNIGYTDGGTYGSADSIWSDPVAAADATAGWLKGQNTIPGYGAASSGVQGILSTAGQAPQSQIAALQSSGWASSGYPDLGSLYQQVAG